MKKILLTSILALAGLFVAPSCLTPSEDGTTALDEMSELEYVRLSQYISLGTEIGVSRLLSFDQTSAGELGLVADALEGLVGRSLLELSSGWLTDAVSEKVMLTSDELLLLLMIVEQEVLVRGGGTYIDPETGELRLTKRTEGLLLVVASVLRAASMDWSRW